MAQITAKKATAKKRRIPSLSFILFFEAHRRIIRFGLAGYRQLLPEKSEVLGLSPANRKPHRNGYFGSSLQSQTISRRFSELSAAHSSRRTTRQPSTPVTGAGALPSSASRMPA